MKMKKQQQEKKIDPKPGHFYLLKESVGQAIAWAIGGGLEKMCGRVYFHCLLLALDSRSMEIKVKKGMVQHNRLRPTADIVQEIPPEKVEQMLAAAGLEAKKIFSRDDCPLAV
ncbi:MAG: hypothetical protein A3J65_01080 [Candidatus Buchananbacteria bacterium RIFCSPHIGHO2_02_FULL_45_11b]|uniref:Uncharacterized protein n=3 Tax=Candidatus Buchananiibacteriota TaxID=1817903 RepID=A0A1G1YGM9_9BACT|nr:MAG: hypothetical protein A2663_00535 [Candidatus Buchananbacteria bacterium RIFCSPHIGHO2_01_FULL_46_12]OGY51505.1 MAG: hypothetical protein A3J65_01080 [Candidatus Buchananbacteria bacterium RIFCSPHIGHO2_02_FULL_45_11b]OGY57301.1 MAG: hypothetical protein A3H67_01675 [Candidatus Buchananbacteria bacterium RIFCSPLOWO2_02_FULL_46_11b]